ncbi:flavodoxin family protein [Christiangramia echinicola]|uniref:Multimeric flavodoxin WrbA n=1 Tax=Christiangramia echinicola TaxID=279359 RepID=A0A1H1SEW4_9FLAO|nr:flavodoxin family protein [Christiangramia echinicola]SDS46266.1 Multimeric flavodoxin WrbA [Christiangramia echinicola]
MENNFDGLNAVFVNCTLKKSPSKSHTRDLMDVSIKIMESEGVNVETIRLADYHVPVGVQPDMTKEGEQWDDWPKLYKKIIAADILVIGTPIWLGERSSVASKLIERLYAMSGYQNDKGQYVYYGKVGGCLITGNEDGVKHCAMGILYALQHLGYSIPPQADAGWIGEVGPGPSYGDKEWNGEKKNPPVGYDSDFTNRNTTFMTYNLLHLAKMLKENGGYPAYGNSRKEWNDGTRWNFENPEYR